METFKKRQKEMKRLEKQRDKAAKRQEIKARKASGLPYEPEIDTLTSAEALASEEPTAALSTMN
jgi:hypothetical protein